MKDGLKDQACWSGRRDEEKRRVRRLFLGLLPFKSEQMDAEERPLLKVEVGLVRVRAGLGWFV